MTAFCFIGLDLGTSGCRALAIDGDRHVIAEARTTLPAPVRPAPSAVEQHPHLWWDAVVRVLGGLVPSLGDHRPRAICVDGTSSTLLLSAADGTPLAPALMYNDARGTAEARRIAEVAPPQSPVCSAGSSLAKLLHLKDRLNPPVGTLALHQSDWIFGRLSGQFGISDWHNALKMGYDPHHETWPHWIARLDLGTIVLPQVLPPGTLAAKLCRDAAQATGLPAGMLVAAGTTDSTAAVMAAGVRDPGEAVTSLGSTLVLKVLATQPVTAPQYGVYSHRFDDLWLVGGASNSGGAVLRQFFDDAEIAHLSKLIMPDAPTGLDYYPLPATGERFPINDPELRPRLRPRPLEDSLFFQGLLEGIAGIEVAGYHRLHSLGAPAPIRVVSIGGGAGNDGWTRIRERLLRVPVTPATIQEAAYGAALLALRAATAA